MLHALKLQQRRVLQAPQSHLFSTGVGFEVAEDGTNCFESAEREL